MRASHKWLGALGAELVVAGWLTTMLGCGGSAPKPEATTPTHETKTAAQSEPPAPDLGTEADGGAPPTPHDIIPPDPAVAADPSDSGTEPRPRLGPRPMVEDLLPPDSPPARMSNDSDSTALDPVAEDQPLAYRLDEPPTTDADSSAIDTVEGRDPAPDPAAPDNQNPQVVTVYFATDRDREAAEDAAGSSAWAWSLAGIGAAGGLLCYTVSGWSRYRRGMRLLASGFAGIAVLGVVTAVIGTWRASDTQLATGVRYGNQRGELQLGTCRVSIPWSHKVGQVERPSLLRLEVREDVQQHVVLHETEQLDPQDFFSQLRQQVQAAPRPEVFVFVHGYNVTFAGAARRTAQIAHDVEFAGAPIFFSWPSQGGLLKYTIDENNVEWAVPHLRQFLLDVTRRSGATHVNLIAHSMGNRALAEALREILLQLQTETALFNQVILAAPDIDAEIFRRDLAPALVRTAQRVTLYASSRDQALVASKKVHGYPRAGDSGGEVVVLDGIETVDVSQLDTNLLGHSYYGSSNPILLDMQLLIERALPAAQREWLLPRAYGELTYWIFEERSARAIGQAKPL